MVDDVVCELLSSIHFQPLNRMQVGNILLLTVREIVANVYQHCRIFFRVDTKASANTLQIPNTALVRVRKDNVVQVLDADTCRENTAPNRRRK